MNQLERLRERNKRHDLGERNGLAQLGNRELTDLFISTRNRRGWASSMEQVGLVSGIIGTTINAINANYAPGVITDAILMATLTLVFLMTDKKIHNRISRIIDETQAREARLLAVLKS